MDSRLKVGKDLGLRVCGSCVRFEASGGLLRQRASDLPIGFSECSVRVAKLSP